MQFHKALSLPVHSTHPVTHTHTHKTEMTCQSRLFMITFFPGLYSGNNRWAVSSLERFIHGTVNVSIQMQSSPGYLS